MVKLELPDGNILDVSENSTILSIAQQIGSRLAEAAIAAKVDGILVDLS